MRAMVRGTAQDRARREAATGVAEYGDPQLQDTPGRSNAVAVYTTKSGVPQPVRRVVLHGDVRWCDVRGELCRSCAGQGCGLVARLMRQRPAGRD